MFTNEGKSKLKMAGAIIGLLLLGGIIFGGDSGDQPQQIQPQYNNGGGDVNIQLAPGTSADDQIKIIESIKR